MGMMGKWTQHRHLRRRQAQILAALVTGMGITGMGVAGDWPSATAAPAPAVAPVPDWVHPVEAPETVPSAPADAALALLLSDQQISQDDKGSSLYQETVFRVQTPQGLQAGGAQSLVWQPDIDTLTVHKYLIRRGGQTIDLLARNQPFTILRRETNLEAAALDGALTVTLQAVGLQVGDVVDIAYTTTRNDPLLHGQLGLALSAPWQLPIGRVHMRALWPDTLPVHWASFGDLKPQTGKAGSKGTQELVVDQHDMPSLIFPDGAPLRYGNMRQVQFSSYASPADVVALTRPLFEKASVLKADSPLLAEIARIRASGGDAKAQAAQALALVEDQIRYFYLGMADGPLVPADADTTWERRYGDCKAKTVLLLAILRALDIKAEPVLVNTQVGDGLDSYLPMPALFNHVLVRAHIAGQDYWLDGTRRGDAGRPLDVFKIPPYVHWGLPLKTGGTEMVAMVPPPLDVPANDLVWRIDASNGISLPAPTTGTLLLHSDAAIVLKATLDNLSPTARDQVLRKFWQKRRSDFTPEQVEAHYDAATTQETLSVKGSVTLDWGGTDNTIGFPKERLWLYPSGVGWEQKSDRTGSVAQDAPYLNSYPSFDRNLLSITLPTDAKGFTLEGDDVDQTVAGYAFHRRSRIKDNIVTVETSTRALTPERPARDEPVSAAKLNALSDTTEALIRPRDYTPTAAEAARIVTQPATTADTLSYQGYLQEIRLKDFPAGDAAFDRAIAVDPNDFITYARRGWASLLAKNNSDAARRDFEKALSLSPGHPMPSKGMIELDEKAENWQGAIEIINEFNNKNPGSPLFGEDLIFVHTMIGNFESALSDCDDFLKANPESRYALKMRILLLQEQGHLDEALIAAAAAIETLPGSTEALEWRAALEKDMGKREDAVHTLDKVIALEPTDAHFLERARYWPRNDLEHRQKDVEQAMIRSPGNQTALLAQALIQEDAGDFDKAEATLQHAISIADADSSRSALLAMGRYYVHTHQDEKARDVYQHIRSTFTDPVTLNNLCYAQAKDNFDLEKAAADCDLSLNGRPNSGTTQDSQGFVRLRQGIYDKAIIDYQAAIHNGNLGHAGTWFGMGIAKLRLGQTEEGWADIKHARAIRPIVDEEFARYGVAP